MRLVAHTINTQDYSAAALTLSPPDNADINTKTTTGEEGGQFLKPVSA